MTKLSLCGNPFNDFRLLFSVFMVKNSTPKTILLFIYANLMDIVQDPVYPTKNGGKKCDVVILKNYVIIHDLKGVEILYILYVHLKERKRLTGQ